MIDLLIQMFGPTLANKLFDSNGPTTEDLAAALSKLAEDTQHHNASLARIDQQLQTIAKVDTQQSKAIGDIYHELKGLTPHNLNPQLDEIRDWMRRHVESEEQTLRELAQKQLYWNVALSCVAGLALLAAILCLTTK